MLSSRKWGGDKKRRKHDKANGKNIQELEGRKLRSKNIVGK